LELFIKQNILTASIYLLAGVVGVAVFTYPFFINDSTMVGGEALQLRSNLAPLLTMLLLLISLTVLFLEAQGQAVNAKIIASLGVLVAATSTLRFLEVAIPGPGGFSPMFVPILLSGYVFGARFGFLMGTMTMLVSALLTGGIGPWLPYQMFAAGWIGLTAGWLPHFSNLRREVALLVLFGFLWGVLYGVILNLYFWPFVSGDDVSGWTQGIGAADALERYIAFYLTTSFVWDLARAFGNGLLIAILAIPIIRVFGRFRDKFQFEVLGA
jgi:energy-coupling factor transport system substrate-specific component